MAIWTPQFRGTASFYAVLQNLPLLGLISLGFMATMISGELDLAITSIAAVGGVVTAQVAGAGLVPALVLGTLSGTALGLVQGWLIGRLRISSLSFTIGSLILIRGLAFVAAGDTTVQIQNLNVTNIFLNRYWIFSFASIVALCVYAVVGIFLSVVRYGRELYAVGGGRAEARALGIPPGRPLLIAFAISGTCAALAGALTTMQGGAADPAAFSDTLIFGVAGAIIGGVSLYGGRGTVINVLLGVLLLGVLSAGLTAHGEMEATTNIVTGVVLLVVVGFAALGHVLARLGIVERFRIGKAQSAGG